MENMKKIIDIDETHEINQFKKQGLNHLEDHSQDDIFNFDGYQVVRGEFFAHIHEPSITFNKCKVSLNTACLKKMPDVDYVQILVNQNEKKLAVRPSIEDKKDSFLWCTSSRRPKQITCRIFFAKIVQLMDWNPDYKYKLLGKLKKSGDEFLFVFDLSSTQIYPQILGNSNKQKNSRTPVFPIEWHNQFGLPFEEHRKLLQVNIFNGYTVFALKNKSSEDQEDIPDNDLLGKDSGL